MRFVPYKIGLAFVLAVIWLANSGVYIPLITGLGLASVIFVVMLSRRMNLLDNEAIPFHLSKRLPAYYLWLIKQIVLSNVDVVRRVWGGSRSLSPQVADVKIGELSDMAKVIYANSITLTPGTVVLDLKGQNIRVHSISKEGMESLLEGELGRRIARLESP
jgi:multicomponent Na+:H+ antiporter subunit E